MRESFEISLAFCWCLTDVAPEEGLQRVRAAGFDGIELWPDDLRRFGAQRWAGLLQNAGLRCVQLCPYFDFVSGTKSKGWNEEHFTEFLHAALVMGCNRLRVFTGPPWGPGRIGSAQATVEQWTASILGLREFCDVASEHGIELCLECHEGGLMDTSHGALRLLHEVSSKNLTVNLQLPLVGEHWCDSVDRLAAYTRHIHLHNWTSGLGVGDLTFIDEGAFDWAPVLTRLRERGCPSVCLSVEHATHDGRHDPLETVRRDGRYLSTLWNSVLRPTYAH